jgi:sec-independent protein translocase protein TatA
MASTIAFLPNVGLPELLILFAILILIFGPKRIPQAARSLGRGIRNFRESVSGEEKPELPEGESAEAAGTDKAPERSGASEEGKPGP